MTLDEQCDFVMQILDTAPGPVDLNTLCSITDTTSGVNWDQLPSVLAELEARGLVDQHQYASYLQTVWAARSRALFADTPDGPISTANQSLVGVHGRSIVIRICRPALSRRAALNLAAWLVALADDHDEFPDLLERVRNT